MNAALETTTSVKPLFTLAVSANTSAAGGVMISYLPGIDAWLKSIALLFGAIGAVLAVVAWLLLIAIRARNLRRNKNSED